MTLDQGTTLKTAEKKFGPSLPGRGETDKTVSALRHAKGKGKKFAGIPGIHPDAVFYIRFPLPVDFSLLTSKKGTPDHLSDLKEDGPQSKQGRDKEVEQFLETLRREQTLAQLAGTKLVYIEIDGQRFESTAKVSFVKKARKIKVSAEFKV